MCNLEKIPLPDEKRFAIIPYQQYIRIEGGPPPDFDPSLNSGGANIAVSLIHISSLKM
jgi:hypothetical protein